MFNYMYMYCSIHLAMAFATHIDQWYTSDQCLGGVVGGAIS